MAGQPFGDRSRSVMRAVLIGLVIAAAVLVLDARPRALFAAAADPDWRSCVAIEAIREHVRET
jgi:hypothetical protein